MLYQLNLRSAMKTVINGIFGVSLLLVSMFISSTSYASFNASLKLKGADGKIYSCTADANGKFNFGPVQPGTYSLLWILPDAEESPSGPCVLDFFSFSWGAAKKGVSSSFQATGNKKPSSPGARVVTGMVSISDFHFSCDASKSSDEGNEYALVLLEDVVITSSYSPGGSISNMTTMYDLKRAEK